MHPKFSFSKLNPVLMAATTAPSSSKPETRRLGELLKQQQEPFVLEIYLSERGCLKNNKLSSTSSSSSKPKYSSIGCHGSSSAQLLKKNLKVVIFNKLFPSKGLKTQNSDDGNGKLGGGGVTEPNRISSARSSTVYNSCSDGETDEREKKAVADTKLQWNSMEDGKQDSPQSVLEEEEEDMLSTSTSSPIDKTRRISSLFLSKLIMEEEPILSASLWKFLLQTTPRLRELREAAVDDDGANSSRISISKTVSLQTKEEDPFDNNHDELAKMMKLLELDGIDSTKKWNDYEHQEEDIGLVIGDAIAEDIIIDVVLDMIL